MSADSSLKTTALNIGYSSKGKNKTLANALNLTLNQGELICLLGPNGAGKSTLIRTLAGMLPPLSGSIHLGEHSFADISPRERAKLVSVVLTDNQSIGMMDAATLVSLGRHPYSGWLGGLTTHDHECITKALQAVGAESLSNRQISELSDGERQKVSIARALAQEASIMLLDEPTAFLDFPRKVELMRLLQSLTHQKNLSLLLSTHDLELAARFADRIWILSTEGTLTEADPKTLKQNSALADAFGCERLSLD
ncbi:MAG: ABC transporter ATP-binding protein [Opitutaceae bacterium]